VRGFGKILKSWKKFFDAKIAQNNVILSHKKLHPH